MAATVLVVVALVGCSAETLWSPSVTAPPAPAVSGEAPPGAPSLAGDSTDDALLASVTLTGNLGTMPFFTFDAPLTLSGEVAREADEGTGRVVEPGDAVAVHVASVDARTGTIEGSSYEEDQGPELLMVDQDNLPPALYEAMVGARVGSRLLFGAPTDSATTIYSFEVLATAPPFEQAEGTTVDPPDGLPAVVFPDAGPPELAPVPGDPPTSLVVQPLVEGDGDPVGADSWLVVSYGTWLWDGTTLVSTWDEGRRAVVRMADAVVGWQEGLEGRSIGSRVLLVVPPDKAYGEEGTASIPPGATVVYVIDVLAAM